MDDDGVISREEFMAALDDRGMQSGLMWDSRQESMKEIALSIERKVSRMFDAMTTGPLSRLLTIKEFREYFTYDDVPGRIEHRRAYDFLRTLSLNQISYIEPLEGEELNIEEDIFEPEPENGKENWF